ncbi:MAG: Ig-like domain-containing protein, partial [Bacteroidales bacterium]
MKKLNVLISMVLISGFALFSGCDKTPDTFTLESLTAGDINLAGVTAATDVPGDAVIKAVFSYDLDPATVTKANIAITLTEDDSAVDYTLATGGDSVMITPTEGWPDGSQFTIDLSSNIMGMNEVAYAGNSLTFRTSGIFVPQKDQQVLFISFDNETIEDEAGTHTVTEVLDVTFEADRRGTAGSAGYFDGEGSIVEVGAADDLISGSITYSVWFKTALTNYDGGSGTGYPQTRFMFGLGAERGYFLEMGRRSNDPTSDGFQEIFYKLGSNHVNVGNNAEAVPEATAWTELNSQINVNFEAGVQAGWSYGVDQLLNTNDPLNRTYLSDMTMNKWTHFVWTVDANAQTKTIYINGTKMGTFQWHDGDA